MQQRGRRQGQPVEQTAPQTPSQPYYQPPPCHHRTQSFFAVGPRPLPASPRQTLAVHPRPRPRPRATACQATGRAAARSAVAPPSQHPRALAAQPAGLPYLRESLADNRFRHRAPQPVQFPDLDDVFHVRAQALGAEGEGPALALVRCLVVLDREGNGVLPQALVALGAHVWPLGQTAQGRL